MNRLVYFVCGLFFLSSQIAVAYTKSDSEGPNISRHAESLLKERRFDELEKLVNGYRRNNTRTRGGVPALYFFYPGISGSGSKDLFVSTIPDKERFLLLQEWMKLTPASATPKIAIAKYWIAQAWTTRGGGYASTVSDAQWKVFHDLVEKAATYLVNVNPKIDPMIYYQKIEIAKDESAPREILDSLYSKAISTFPDYYEYYIQRSDVLQEKWFGKPGEFAKYASSLPEIRDQDIGVIAYSFVIVHLLTSCDCNSNTIFRSMGLSWKSTKQGFDARLKKYGLRNRDWNEMTLLAALAGHAADAKVALEHISEWDPPIWRSRQEFDRAVAWINAMVAANAHRQIGSRSSPSATTSSER